MGSNEMDDIKEVVYIDPTAISKEQEKYFLALIKQEKYKNSIGFYIAASYEVTKDKEISFTKSIEKVETKRKNEIARYMVYGKDLGAGGQGSVQNVEGILIIKDNDSIVFKRKEKYVAKTLTSKIEAKKEHAFLKKLEYLKYNIIERKESNVLIFNKHLKTDLYKIYKEQENITAKQRFEIFLGILYGLKRLHGKDIIHLDLKPHNVMVNLSTSPVSVTLIDFGLSANNNEEVKDVSGTPGYTPFDDYDFGEEIKAKIHPKMDVYSAGLMGCELFGKNPQWSDDIKKLSRSSFLLAVNRLNAKIVAGDFKVEFNKDKISDINTEKLGNLFKKMLAKKDKRILLNEAIEYAEAIQKEFLFKDDKNQEKEVAYDNAVKARKEGDVLNFVGYNAVAEGNPKGQLISQKFKNSLKFLLDMLDIIDFVEDHQFDIKKYQNIEKHKDDLNKILKSYKNCPLIIDKFKEVNEANISKIQKIKQEIGEELSKETFVNVKSEYYKLSNPKCLNDKSAPLSPVDKILDSLTTKIDEYITKQRSVFGTFFTDTGRKRAGVYKQWLNDKKDNPEMVLLILYAFFKSSSKELKKSLSKLKVGDINLTEDVLANTFKKKYNKDNFEAIDKMAQKMSEAADRGESNFLSEDFIKKIKNSKENTVGSTLVGQNLK